VLRPLSQGVISEFSMTTNLLKALIKRAYTKQKTWFRPSLLLTLPKDVTPVEEKAFREAGFSAGAREVKLLPEPVAAAIGVGIDIFNPNGEMIIDVGGGITEISLFCLGDIVFNQSIRTGGDDLNETIKQFVRKKYNFEIGNSTAEKLKQALSFSGNFNELDSLRIKGINRVSGFPSTLDIKKGEVIEVLKPRLELISQSVIQALENAPEELSADLVKSGINLVGGGALTHGLKALIEKSTGLPVKLFNAPLLAVAKGEVSILQSKFLSTELRPLY